MKTFILTPLLWTHKNRGRKVHVVCKQKNKVRKNVPGDDLVFVDAVFGVSPQQICLQERKINHNAKKRKHAKKKNPFCATLFFACSSFPSSV